MPTAPHSQWVFGQKRILYSLAEQRRVAGELHSPVWRDPYQRANNLYPALNQLHFSLLSSFKLYSIRLSPSSPPVPIFPPSFFAGRDQRGDAGLGDERDDDTLPHRLCHWAPPLPHYRSRLPGSDRQGVARADASAGRPPSPPSRSRRLLHLPPLPTLRLVVCLTRW